MAINDDLAKQKVNELNRSAIKIIDILTALEQEKLYEVALTSDQITALKDKAKKEGNNLKDLAGNIKDIVWQ